MKNGRLKRKVESEKWNGKAESKSVNLEVKNESEKGNGKVKTKSEQWKKK